jgi:hypothetical protein
MFVDHIAVALQVAEEVRQAVLVAPALQISHCLDTVPLFIPLSHDLAQHKQKQP